MLYYLLSSAVLLKKPRLTMDLSCYCLYQEMSVQPPPDCCLCRSAEELHSFPETIKNERATVLRLGTYSFIAYLSLSKRDELQSEKLKTLNFSLEWCLDYKLLNQRHKISIVNYCLNYSSTGC